ncbi:MAG: hypothetical protein M2R45_02955 [Verrucomicrobia subdivision 3 bacterium]|nr:hypothetical protein [Limisphaerales bacterium]MCS1415325.1 hypothetical protein [Limisphaerales bacterium]
MARSDLSRFIPKPLIQLHFGTQLPMAKVSHVGTRAPINRPQALTDYSICTHGMVLLECLLRSNFVCQQNCFGSTVLGRNRKLNTSQQKQEPQDRKSHTRPNYRETEKRLAEQ